jgi:hypothetical protein
MRFSDEPLEVGLELVDGGDRYRVVRVERPPNPALIRARLSRAPHHRQAARYFAEPACFQGRNRRQRKRRGHTAGARR